MVTFVRFESWVYVLFGIVPWCSEKHVSITEHHILCFAQLLARYQVFATHADMQRPFHETAGF